jgi:hypothetical protein
MTIFSRRDDTEGDPTARLSMFRRCVVEPLSRVPPTSHTPADPALAELADDEVWREILLDWRGVLLDDETWREVLGDEIEIGTEEGGTAPWLEALEHGGDDWFAQMFALLTPEHRAAGIAATLGLSPTRLPRTPQRRRSHAPTRPRARARRAAKRGACRAGPDDDPDPPPPRDVVPGLTAASRTVPHALPGGQA